MAATESISESVTVEAQANAGFDDPNTGAETTVSSNLVSAPVEPSAPDTIPLTSVNEPIDLPTLNFVAQPGDAPVPPDQTDWALQSAEPLNLLGTDAGQGMSGASLPLTNAQVSSPDEKTGKISNETTVSWAADTARLAPVVARVEGEPGRTASTEELLAAYANGAVQPKDITLQEQANLLGQGVPAAELGISPVQAAALPAVSDPGASELSPTSLALQDFQKNAGGEVRNLLGNPNIDPGTLAVVNPASIGLSSDGSIKNADAGGVDPRSSMLSTNAGASLVGDGTLGKADGGLGAYSLSGKLNGALIADRPTGADVSGNLSDEVRQSLYSRIKNNDPVVGNFMNANGMATTGSALKAYVDGKGGIYTLPKEFANSDLYFRGPSVSNTETLLDRAMSGESKTPATQNLRQRLSDLKPGESITFKDYNNKLIDVRELGESAYTRLQQSEIDRIKTVGNAIFNTSSDVTIRYPGKGKNYEVTMNSTHTLIDRYDWNATARDRPEDAASTTFLPVGGGELLPVNHKDLAAMKSLGAKDFTDGMVVRQKQNYVIPERSIRADAVPPMGWYPSWETGYLGQMRRGSSAPAVVTDPNDIRSNLARAAAQNPKARITVGVDEPVRPLPIVKYTPGVIADPSRPKNPSRRGQPTEF